MIFLIIDLVLRVASEGRGINVVWRHGTFRGRTWSINMACLHGKERVGAAREVKMSPRPLTVKTRLLLGRERSYMGGFSVAVWSNILESKHKTVAPDDYRPFLV